MSRQMPQDPMIRELISRAKASQVTRRTMLAGAGAGATAMALAACSTGGDEAPTAAVDNSATDKTLTWANWAAYIDEDDQGNYPTLEGFHEQTGISVNYDVAVDDNNT